MIGFLIEIVSERCAFILGWLSMPSLLAVPMALFCASVATVESFRILHMVPSQAGDKSNLLETGRPKGLVESFLFGASVHSPGYTYACHTSVSSPFWWTAAPPILALLPPVNSRAGMCTALLGHVSVECVTKVPICPLRILLSPFLLCLPN